MRWMSWVLAVGWPLVIFFLVTVVRRRRHEVALEQRLDALVRAHVPAPVSPKSTALPAISWRERWHQGPNAAALRLRVSEYFMFRVASFVVPFALGFVIRGIIGGAVLGLLGIVGLSVYFRMKRQRWLRKAEETLPEFLRGVSSTLRAGSSLSQAMNLVAQETAEPLGSEVLRALRRESLGFNLTETLTELTRRIPSRDLGLAVMAITIQREVGGSLADLLDNIVKTIVDRQRLKREIRIITSQGRYSGWVLTALPFILGILIWFANPGYMGPMFHSPIGWAMLAGAGVAIGLGGFVINRLVQAPDM